MGRGSFSVFRCGRQTSDQATTLGANVASTIRRLDTGGRPYLFTSYADLAGIMTRNQVEDLFNGFGQLVTEYQAHAGPEVPGSSPSVQYAYSYDPTQMTNANYSRPVSMTYPSGRTIYDNYAGLDNTISRLTSITDGSPTGTTLEAETYLGLDMVVQRAHPESGVNLSYINLPTGSGDAGDQYNGLDRFGRVVDQYWGPSGSPTDNVTYTYDRDGNRLSRSNLVNPAFNEQYMYDAFNQLTRFTRGSHVQTWSLDVLGNWTSFMDDTNGTQARNHNLQNQITSLSGGAGGQTPGYDADGNTTHDEFGNVLTYDAWNRLVQVATGGNPMTVLAGYGYDALGRRISETRGFTTTDVYFSSQWQVLEERVNGATTAQYVWSPGYVDALVERDAGGTRLYVQQDANFNVTGLVDTTGTVVERYAYDPYGKATVLDPGTWTVRGAGQYGTSSYGWVYLHQGGRYDTATGLYNFRNRDYSPTLGRWMQQDPARFSAGDNNLYGFVKDSPDNSTDPLGLGVTSEVGHSLFYTCNCGWIDTNHLGDVEEVSDLIEKVKKASKAGGFIDQKIGHLDGIRRQYWVDKTNDNNQIMRVAYAIWTSLSYDHESHQNDWMHWLIGNNSSFSAEDLPTNQMAFYLAATRGLKDFNREKDTKEWENLKHKCGGAVPDDTARRLLQNLGGDLGVGALKNRSFMPKDFNSRPEVKKCCKNAAKPPADIFKAFQGDIGHWYRVTPAEDHFPQQFY